MLCDFFQHYSLHFYNLHTIELCGLRHVDNSSLNLFIQTVSMCVPKMQNLMIPVPAFASAARTDSMDGWMKGLQNLQSLKLLVLGKAKPSGKALHDSSTHWSMYTDTPHALVKPCIVSGQLHLLAPLANNLTSLTLSRVELNLDQSAIYAVGQLTNLTELALGQRCCIVPGGVENMSFIAWRKLSKLQTLAMSLYYMDTPSTQYMCWAPPAGMILSAVLKHLPAHQLTHISFAAYAQTITFQSMFAAAMEQDWPAMPAQPMGNAGLNNGNTMSGPTDAQSADDATVDADGPPTWARSDLVPAETAAQLALSDLSTLSAGALSGLMYLCLPTLDVTVSQLSSIARLSHGLRSLVVNSLTHTASTTSATPGDVRMLQDAPDVCLPWLTSITVQHGGVNVSEDAWGKVHNVMPNLKVILGGGMF